MGLFNFNKNNETKVELDKTKTELTKVKSELSSFENKKTNLLRSIKTDSMDLSAPFIDDQFTKGVNWVYFGETNLYPQILNELYLSSPMHSACVDFKTWSVVGDGYEWKGYDKLKTTDKISIKHFERHNKFKPSVKKLTKDWVKHGRAIVLLHRNQTTNTFDSFKVVDPSEIRNNRATLFDEITAYYYSHDWVYRTKKITFTPYSPSNKDEWQIFEVRNDVGGSRTYGLPDWVSSANWQKVSASLGLLHKSALENGIQPSVLFMYPTLMDDDEERNWINSMQNNYKGVENYNRGMLIQSQGKEMMPEVKVLETSDNHQLFEQTSKEQKEEIAISHNINPALMGVRIAGSLGASDEIEFSSKQFEKIWLNDNRTIIEDFINDIAVICGINTELVINKTEVTSIAAAMSKDGSTKDVELEDVDENGEKKEAVIINENLRGLTAKENSDIYRIVRDYNKGRLNLVIAKARLMAYGIDGDAAEEILKTEE